MDSNGSAGVVIQPNGRSIEELLADRPLIDAALKRAARDAILRHKKLGNPIAVWENEQLVWLQPHEITVDDDEPTAALV